MIKDRRYSLIGVGQCAEGKESLDENKKETAVINFGFRMMDLNDDGYVDLNELKEALSNALGEDSLTFLEDAIVKAEMPPEGMDLSAFARFARTDARFIPLFEKTFFSMHMQEAIHQE